MFDRGENYHRPGPALAKCQIKSCRIRQEDIVVQFTDYKSARFSIEIRYECQDPSRVGSRFEQCQTFLTGVDAEYLTRLIGFVLDDSGVGKKSPHRFGRGRHPEFMIEFPEKPQLAPEGLARAGFQAGHIFIEGGRQDNDSTCPSPVPFLLQPFAGERLDGVIEAVDLST
jgi:hypothetical protein